MKYFKIPDFGQYWEKTWVKQTIRYLDMGKQGLYEGL